MCVSILFYKKNCRNIPKPTGGKKMDHMNCVTGYQKHLTNQKLINGSPT